MSRTAIREAEVEDALTSYLVILRDILEIKGEVHLIAKELRLIAGQRRLDILLTARDEIYLVELKTTKFHPDQIEQVLSYKRELQSFQENKQLIAGEIVPVLLVTDFTDRDLELCEENGINIYKYSPKVVLTEYYGKIAEIARFMKIKPIDLGVFNIGLINRMMSGFEKSLSTLKELSKFSRLSERSMAHHVKFAMAFGLVAQRKNRYYLTDLGLKYVSLKDEIVTGYDLSDEQTELLREYIAKDPFSSPIVFGIYTIVESVFYLARNNYPVSLQELRAFFLKASGKKFEWQAPKTLSTATYTYLNYAIKLGLLGKIGNNIVITPSGFRFILMLQLYKSIQMVETLTSESGTKG